MLNPKLPIPRLDREAFIEYATTGEITILRRGANSWVEIMDAPNLEAALNALDSGRTVIITKNGRDFSMVVDHKEIKL